jgi:folate-binding protein YgfZ
MSGIAWVELATFEAFVPQMLNYESVDGVNFKKGCYPGQEVVARSQFRGTLKRRTYLVSSDSALDAGQEVFKHSSAHAADTSQEPVGLVAHAAHHSVHGDWALVCLQNSALEDDATQGDSRLCTASGASLSLRALPYALREDI